MKIERIAFFLAKGTWFRPSSGPSVKQSFPRAKQIPGVHGAWHPRLLAHRIVELGGTTLRVGFPYSQFLPLIRDDDFYVQHARIQAFTSVALRCSSFFFSVGCSSDDITLEDLEKAAANVEVDTDALAKSLEGESATKTVRLDVEKPDLKFGFIKLTDCAPLVIAKEKGYFEDEGLNVELAAQSNWKDLLDAVINSSLDGAHMLAGQPIGATIGIGTKADVITAYSLDYNGNGITVSNDIWAKMQENDPKLKAEKPEHPITAASLKPIVDEYKQEGKDFNMGMVFPVSTHNYEIRYWLAAAGN